MNLVLSEPAWVRCASVPFFRGYIFQNSALRLVMPCSLFDERTDVGERVKPVRIVAYVLADHDLECGLTERQDRNVAVHDSYYLAHCGGVVGLCCCIVSVGQERIECRIRIPAEIGA